MLYLMTEMSYVGILSFKQQTASEKVLGNFLMPFVV